MEIQDLAAYTVGVSSRDIEASILSSVAGVSTVLYGALIRQPPSNLHRTAFTSKHLLVSSPLLILTIPEIR